MVIMKTREQVVFDIGQDKYKYLQREELKIPKRADMTELNKRLNQSKKINIYNNTKIIIFFLFCLGLVAMISLKF